METLTDIKFSPDADKLMKQAHIEAGSDDEIEFRSMLDTALKIARPKAAYTVSFIDEKEDNTVTIEGVTFTSRTLSKNLKSVERVFAFVATCGKELNEPFFDDNDMVKEYWWDLIKSSALYAAHQYLMDYLHRKYRLDKTASMMPGSGDVSIWPIEQQKGLFELLGDTESQIGVKLTDSFLMVPNKTLSGILFPTEKDFQSCQVCHRENCPSRKAAFNENFWDETQTD